MAHWTRLFSSFYCLGPFVTNISVHLLSSEMLQKLTFTVSSKFRFGNNNNK
jgi:hypothetical protein